MMTLNEYQWQIITISSAYPQHRTERSLPMYILGLVEEAGEVAGIVKRHYRGDYSLYSASEERESKVKEDLKEELGDTLAYLCLVAEHFGFTLEDLAKANLSKLEKRLLENKHYNE